MTAARKAQSDSTMHLLATGMESYRRDSGKMPSRLADLVPKYFKIEKGVYIHSGNAGSIEPPASLGGGPEVIEAFLPYFYLPLKGDRFVVAERPGTWKDGTVGYVLSGEPNDSVISLTSSSHHRVKIDEFMRLLEEGFPEANDSPNPAVGK